MVHTAIRDTIDFLTCAACSRRALACALSAARWRQQAKGLTTYMRRMTWQLFRQARQSCQAARTIAAMVLSRNAAPFSLRTRRRCAAADQRRRTCRLLSSCTPSQTERRLLERASQHLSLCARALTMRAIATACGNAGSKVKCGDHEDLASMAGGHKGCGRTNSCARAARPRRSSATCCCQPRTAR